MVLEAQFGPNIAPIERPKVNRPAPAKEETDVGTPAPKAEEEPDERELEGLEEAELARLHALGIPVPGIEIKVDKHVARVWLETLEVECGYSVLRDRLRVVVERAVETVADLWSTKAGNDQPKSAANGVAKDEKLDDGSSSTIGTLKEEVKTKSDTMEAMGT